MNVEQESKLFLSGKTAKNNAFKTTFFFFLKENNEHSRKIHLSVEGVTLSWKDLIRAQSVKL